MKQYWNWSLFVTLLTALGIIYSKSLIGDPFGTPLTDFLVFVIGVVVALIITLITSNRAIMHETTSECFWDCFTDVISILLHIVASFLWLYHGRKIFPENFLLDAEFYLVYALILCMTVIAFAEFLLTLKNSLESMLRNGSVKIND